MASRPSSRKMQPRATLPISRITLFALLVLAGNAPLWVSLDALKPFRELTAWTAGGLIRLSGIDVVQNGSTLLFEQKRWLITPECTALNALIVFAAFVIVYPSGLRSKGIAIAVGFPCILLANLLRLFSLAWMTRWFPGRADLLHDYFWQVAFLLFLAVLWLVWIEKVVRHEHQDTVSV